MLELPRSLLLATWGGAALDGRVSLDEAADRIVGRDTFHRVHGLPGEAGEVALTLALGRLRANGVESLRLALPAPGDPAGLPGPPELNAAAVAAREAVLCGGGPPYALVPETTTLGSSGTSVRWQVHEALPAPPPGVPSLAEADRALQEALREATAELVRLDVARWRPEVATAIASLRDGYGEDVQLAPGVPQRAVRVMTTARRVGTIAALAGEHPGAAVSAAEMSMRTAALAPLERASRTALAAACNAVYEPGEREARHVTGRSATGEAGISRSRTGQRSTER